ncbi:MAG: type II toxin-antitoxin system VapC family toxin [Desulfovibrionaceae bacterium]|nr:type II toxin-antitoxin system VapC family toxin [Desulfovibrionaceae bacterium]
MSGKFLLDTNIILYYLKGDRNIADFLAEHREAVLYVSVITRMELLSFHGMTPSEEKHIHDVLSPINVLPITEDIEETAINFRRATRKKLPDAVVAASAIVSKAVLVTYDRELAGTVFPGLATYHPDNPA